MNQSIKIADTYNLFSKLIIPFALDALIIVGSLSGANQL
jgi:hypothetical protein